MIGAPGDGRGRDGPLPGWIRSPEPPTAPTPDRPPTPTTMQILRGIAVSPGIAIGSTLVVDPRGARLPMRRIGAAAVAREHARIDEALEHARAEAEAAEAEARTRLGPQYADILGAHARMISDPTLRDEARARVERERVPAEHALAEVLDGYAARLERLSASHLAARAADVRDIQQRILNQLIEPGASRPTLLPADLDEPTLLLAHDLSPSETAGLDTKMVIGFATEAGGRASHTAIVAEALEIPAVVGLGAFLADIPRRRSVAIVDGDEGIVILDPDEPTLDRYRQAADERAARFRGLADLAPLPARTLDGCEVELFGNIEFPLEVEACRERGALGVGLYRTEFLFLNAEAPPSEEEQYRAYADVMRSLGGRPITIRTLDLGAEKLPTYRDSNLASAANPALGLRSLRLSLRDVEMFRTQLRAILRASALGDVRVMFPLVSTLSEFRQARSILDDVAAGLTRAGVPIAPKVAVGVMIEVPAAAVMAPEFAREVDFFAIGTNDLIQYALAVDRTNETVANLYSASDPAVIRLIKMVVDAAARRDLPVSICGTMGSEPLYAMLLLGLGLRQLSMPPHQIPEIKRVIRAVSLATARSLAAEVLQLDDAEEIAARLREALHQAVPDTPARTPH